jgi:D-glycero-alpha-D-manno-heptose-7-phosphate kinase
MFYTGQTRTTGSVLVHQQRAMARERSKQRAMQRMVALARQLRSELQNNNIDAFGEILHENWELKRGLATAISNPQIDNWYKSARRAGATGGKVLGAGSGGFMIFYAPPGRHDAITAALPKLRPIPFSFESQGSKIIFVHD